MSTSNVDFKRLFEAFPGSYLVLAPDIPRFTVLAASDAYLRDTLTARDAIVGKSVFETFPDNPDDPENKAVAFATASFTRVVECRCVDIMGIREHDVRRPESEGGGFEQRFWNPVNYPILGGDGRVEYILHTVENVTDAMQSKQEEARQLAANVALRKEIAERKKTDEALRTSEEQFRTMANAIPQLAWIARADGYIYWYNQRWYDYTGTTPAQMEGWGWQRVHDPGMLPEVMKQWQSSIATGQPFDMEFPLRGADGVLRPFLTRVMPLKDHGGHVVQWVGTNTDVAERKRSEEALIKAREVAEKRAREAEEGERILHAIMEYLPEGMMVVDAPDGTIRLISRYMTEITGVAPGETIGNNVDIVEARLAPSDQGIEVPTEFPIIRALRNGEIIINEQRAVIKPDGTKFWVLITAAPVKDSQGKIAGALTTWKDITDLKTASDELRRNEYELRTILDNSPDLVVRFSHELRYVYVNPAFERITGMTNEQFAGKTNTELGMPKELEKTVDDALRKVIESGRETSIEFYFSGLFGRRYFWGRLIPEFAKTGLVDTVILIARDITERRKAEERVRYISFHDEVTGLYNRAFFEEEIRRIDTERELPVSIIMGDVNNLKLSNDVFGHSEGDNLLKTIAGILRKACRVNDIVARWGGDEFAVILPKTDFKSVSEVFGRIRQIAVESESTIVQPSIALGVATKERKDQNIYGIIRQAEERMYDNKIADSKRNEDIIFASLFTRARERRKGLDAHIGRSKALAVTYGKELGLSETQIEDLSLLIKLHDIGDAVIPGEILAKPGRLTPREWDIVKKHSEAGLRIVKTFVDTARISDEVFSHAERWDGTGYPRGLKGNEISYLARVFAVIDVYDVITHERPYALAFTPEEAVEELGRNAGKQFDPELVERFIKVVPEQSREKVL